MADRLEPELFSSKAEKLECQWSEAGPGRQPTWQCDSRSNVILSRSVSSIHTDHPWAII